VNATPPIKVLYIVGVGRSGSTILGNILGQIDGLAYLGEMSVIWNRGLIENRLCGCGEKFRECPTWKAIFDEALGGMGGVDAETLTRLRGKVFNPLNALRLVRAKGSFPEKHHLKTNPTPAPPLARGGKSGAGSDWLVEFGEATRAIYRAAQHVTGCRVLVDSSHNPLYAGLLLRLPEIDLRLVHLIRDPRAVVYSRQRQKFDPGRGKDVRTSGPLISGGGWILWNAITESLKMRASRPSLRFRYEDFVREPQKIVREIADFVDEPSAALPFRGEREATIAPAHSVSGNPSRFETGTITLRPDEAWRANGKAGQNLLTTLLTWPLMLRYGYDLFA
jgi:hypothetical protein